MENETLVHGFVTICKKFKVEVYETQTGLFRYKFYLIFKDGRKEISVSYVKLMIETKKISTYAKQYTS